jgi:hypothetical protein
MSITPLQPTSGASRSYRIAVGKCRSRLSGIVIRTRRDMAGNRTPNAAS